MALTFAPVYRVCCVAGALLIGSAGFAQPKPSLLGATRAEVLARFGEPKSQIVAGSREVLFFPTERIVLRDGRVIEADLIAPDVSPPPAPAAKPAPTTTAAPADGAPAPAAATATASPSAAPGAAATAGADAGASTASTASTASVAPPPAPEVVIKSVRPPSRDLAPVAAQPATPAPAPVAAEPTPAPAPPAAPAATPVAATPSPSSEPVAAAPSKSADTAAPAPSTSVPTPATTAPVAAVVPVAADAPKSAAPEPAAAVSAPATPTSSSSVTTAAAALAASGSNTASAAGAAKTPTTAAPHASTPVQAAPSADIPSASDSVFTGRTYLLAAVIVLGGTAYLWWRRRQQQIELAASAVSHSPFIAEPTATSTGGGTRITADVLGKLEWKRFEELVAAYYNKTGVVAVRTKAGPGAAVQIRISWKGEQRPFACVQCLPHPTGLIGPQAVQSLCDAIAAEDIRRGYIVTSGKFGVPARDLAEEKHITLLPGDVFLEKLNALPDPVRAELLKDATAGDHTTPTCPRCEVKMAKSAEAPAGWQCPQCGYALPVE